MNVLIVHAHPEPQSFNSAMAREMAKLWESQGHTVEWSDLYAMQFNPVSGPGDFEQRANPDYLVYALEQRNAVKTNSLPADIATEVEKVKRCDLLVLNFPLYWFSVPAILKGWIDRVFLSGVFYGGRTFYDKGLMAGKRAWVTFTLGGRENMFGEGAVHGDIQTMLRPLLRGTLGYSGFAVHEPFAAYHVPYLPEAERAAIMQNCLRAVETLADRPTLSFPKLEQFDAQMNPLK